MPTHSSRLFLILSLPRWHCSTRRICDVPCPIVRKGKKTFFRILDLYIRFKGSKFTTDTKVCKSFVAHPVCFVFPVTTESPTVTELVCGLGPVLRSHYSSSFGPSNSF